MSSLDSFPILIFELPEVTGATVSGPGADCAAADAGDDAPREVACLAAPAATAAARSASPAVISARIAREPGASLAVLPPSWLEFDTSIFASEADASL